VRVRRFAVAIAVAVGAAPASAMPVSTFLSEFESLDPNASADQLTGRLAELKAELQKDAAELRAERLAASSAGKQPTYCPVEDAAQPSAEEIIAALEAVPKIVRPKMQVKDALRAYLARRFPCTN
jgi:hypothetical protein